jgi:energy-coupling factor transport system permease protein
VAGSSPSLSSDRGRLISIHSAELPAFVRRQPSGPYRSLNPTTKLVVAFATAAIAFAVRGWTGPVAMLALVLASAIVAGIWNRLWPYVLATIPIVISILVVNTFFFPGATDVVAKVGPFTATGAGLAAATQAALRVEAFALSVAVLALTTATDDLLSDLERRGLGRRATFVVGAAISTVPRLTERAREIVDAQRARGLDTEGSLWRRIRGLVPLAGPMIASSLAEVEERTMALEARAFSAPGGRTLLRVLPDTSTQRIARWLIGLGTIVAISLSVGGFLPLP